MPKWGTYTLSAIPGGFAFDGTEENMLDSLRAAH